MIDKKKIDEAADIYASIAMDKVEMKRSQLSEKFGLYATCDIFCVFAKGRKHRGCNFKDKSDMVVRAHCREAENALAVYHNIKLID